MAKVTAGLGSAGVLAQKNLVGPVIQCTSIGLLRN